MKQTVLWLMLGGLACGADRPVFDVRQYGAKGDGRAKDTAAIAGAIAACARAGGGRVYLPPGSYLSGALRMASNVDLHVEAGAVLLASTDPDDYPLVAQPYRPAEKERAGFIHGESLHDVALTGRGAIDGQGEAWWQLMQLNRRRGRGEKLTAAELARVENLKYGRPHLVKLVRCKHVLLEGLTMKNSPAWTVNPVFCEFLTVRGLSIFAPETSPNTDGINPESCRNVHISGCHIDVGDDCVTIKSGKDEDGRRAGVPSENITVTNCTMMRGHGGVVIGSETSGGARNISVSNCVFNRTDKGIRIKSQRGRGGVVEGVAVSNIVMHDVPEAFTMTMYYDRGSMEKVEPVGPGTPVLRDILIQNVTARGSKSAGVLYGLKEMPISGVRFSNVRIAAAKGFDLRMARDIGFHDVEINAAAGPALTARDVAGLELAGFRTLQSGAAPVIDLAAVTRVFLRGCSAPPDAAVFVRAAGVPQHEITLGGNNVKGAVVY